MKQIILITFLFLIFAVSANAQAQTDLEVANQRLDKTLDALESAEKVIVAKDREIVAVRQLNATNEQIIAQQKEVLANTEKLLQIYIKKSKPQFSVLWGLVKIRF